jgi:prephenate dehydrogenase
MTLDKSTNILIIGLGVIGGSYAKALTDKGYNVSCITKEDSDLKYAYEHKMIRYGTTEVEEELVKSSELVIFALYPTTFINWIEKYQHLFKAGALITDVTGIKSGVVYKVQEILREDVEYIPAHPMAGRERSGVEFADP